MFKNLFVITYRNIARNKVISLLNVLGLTIGIKAAITNPVKSLRSE